MGVLHLLLVLGALISASPFASSSWTEEGEIVEAAKCRLTLEEFKRYKQFPPHSSSAKTASFTTAKHALSREELVFYENCLELTMKLCWQPRSRDASKVTLKASESTSMCDLEQVFAGNTPLHVKDATVSLISRLKEQPAESLPKSIVVTSSAQSTCFKACDLQCLLQGEHLETFPETDIVALIASNCVDISQFSRTFGSLLKNRLYFAFEALMRTYEIVESNAESKPVCFALHLLYIYSKLECCSNDCQDRFWECYLTYQHPALLRANPSTLAMSCVFLDPELACSFLRNYVQVHGDKSFQKELYASIIIALCDCESLEGCKFFDFSTRIHRLRVFLKCIHTFDPHFVFKNVSNTLNAPVLCVLDSSYTGTDTDTTESLDAILEIFGSNAVVDMILVQLKSETVEIADIPFLALLDAPRYVCLNKHLTDKRLVDAVAQMEATCHVFGQLLFHSSDSNARLFVQYFWADIFLLVWLEYWRLRLWLLFMFLLSTICQNLCQCTVKPMFSRGAAFCASVVGKMVCAWPPILGPSAKAASGQLAHEPNNKPGSSRAAHI